VCIAFHAGLWRARDTKRLVNEDKDAEKLEGVIEVRAMASSYIHRVVRGQGRGRHRGQGHKASA